MAAPMRPAGATPRLFPFTLTSQDPVFDIPTAWNWNATFQRDVGWGTTVEVGYVGRRGIHNQRKRNINQLYPGTVQANPGVNVNALRPYLGLGIVGLAGELRAVAVQRPAGEHRTPVRHQPALRVGVHVLALSTTIRRRSQICCPTRTTTATTGVSRISTARTCSS